MAISKTKNYLVLNPSASPVSVSTKYESFLIDGGNEESPGSLPLSFDEIAVINSKSPVFKIGILRFDPAVEAELYEALSIPNWKDILTQEQIEEMLISGTMEDLQRLIAIENEAYFGRVRGALVALKNAGADVSTRAADIINARYDELAKHKRKTAIRLTPKEPEKTTSHSQEEFDSMKNELAELKAMMAQMMSATAGNQKPVEQDTKQEKPANKSKPKGNQQ